MAEKQTWLFKHCLLKEIKYVFKSTEELAKNSLFVKMINLGKKCELLGLELVDDEGLYDYYFYSDNFP